MESSDDQKWVKKTKKQMEYSEAADLPKKIKKKKKKTGEKESDGELVKNDADFAVTGKNKPYWLEMTDSEQEFSMPVKGKDKKKQAEGLKTLNEREEDSTISPSKKSPKKKKKADVQVNGDEIGGNDGEAHVEDMIITKASSKKRKAEEGISGKRKKKRDSESSHLLQKAEVEGLENVFEDHEEDSSQKKSKKMKQDEGRDAGTFSHEDLQEEALKKPGKKRIEVLNEEEADGVDDREEYSSRKKGKKMKRKGDGPAQILEENHVDRGGEDVPEEQKLQKKPGKKQIKIINEEQRDDDDKESSSPKKGKKMKRKGDRPGQIMDKNHVERGADVLGVEDAEDNDEDGESPKHVSEEPKLLKKPVKRQNKVPNGEQVSLSEDGEGFSSAEKTRNRKKRREDGPAQVTHKNHVDKVSDSLGDEEESDADSLDHVPEDSKLPKKPVKRQTQITNEEQMEQMEVSFNGDGEGPFSPKKSKKKGKEDGPAQIIQKNHVDQVDNFSEIHEPIDENSLDHVPKRSPKKSAKLQNKSSNEEQVAVGDDAEGSSSPKKSKKKAKEDGPTRITHKNNVVRVEDLLNAENVSADESPEHVPEEEPQEPPKKPVKRQTKVPSEEQVTVGEEYKVRTSREKNCKNCDTNVKLKIKTVVRDMGTQTQVSAVLNWIVGRKVKKLPARVRKIAPVSRKDRIILPKEVEEGFYATSSKKLPLSKELMSKLRNMKITLKEEPLPQHNVGSNNVCRPLSEKEKEEFEKYDRLKTGSFDPAEDEIIVKNWKKFCKKHDWDVKLFNAFTVLRYRGAYYLPTAEQRRTFVQFLARGLPNRCLTTIYKRFKTLFSTHRTERYTPEEDQMILSYIESRPDDNKNNFNNLAEKLNRTRASIWRRYKILIAEKEEQEAV